VITSIPIAMINNGHSVSKLAHQNTSSRSVEAPSIIKKIPISNGQVVLFLPPKQSASMSQSLRLDLKAEGFMDAPQFLQSRASSSFSVPHFVQYTNLITNNDTVKDYTKFTQNVARKH
jgi:hypothetical protein